MGIHTIQQHGRGPARTGELTDPAADPGARSLRVCRIGDSIAAGTGNERCLGWHGRLASRVISAGAELTICPLGVRGDTSEDVAARWERDATVRLPSALPRAIVFQSGLNDCAMRTWDDGAVNAASPRSERSRRRPRYCVRQRPATGR